MMTETPKPSRWLIASSLIVIAASCRAIYAVIAAVAVAWDPWAIFVGAILLPIPVTLAVQQYRGTFRHKRSAARITAVMIWFVGGFAFCILMAGVGEIAASSFVVRWSRAFTCMLAIAACCAQFGALNARWAKRLP